MKTKVIGGTAEFLTDAESAELTAACERTHGKMLTPRLRNRKRIGICLSLEDAHRASGRGTLDYRGIVTDLNTGKQFHIHGAHCGLPNCVCDAVAILVTKGNRHV